MKIWARVNSSNVRKATCCAKELGLAREHTNAVSCFGMVGDAVHLVMNLNGLVPCLKDGNLLRELPRNVSMGRQPNSGRGKRTKLSIANAK